jgi:hypothetical protein
LEKWIEVVTVSFEPASSERVSEGIHEDLEVHTVANNLDILAELACLALDLDAVVEEFFKVGAVKDTVCSGF